MYLPAFPGIAVALHTSTAKVSLSISSYFVGLAAGQLFYGPLLDRFGRKSPLYARSPIKLARLALGFKSASHDFLLRFSASVNQSVAGGLAC
jgi:DHA1 family bicyclomycin/chloramphenicol resistance-like MFS transporter